MIFVLPTVLYVASVVSRTIILRMKSGPESTPKNKGETDKNLFFTFFIDCLILTMLNGLILVFGVGQISFGIALIVGGEIVSILGISSIFSDQEDVRDLLLIIVNIIIVGEFIDFLTYSMLISGGVIIGLIAVIVYLTVRTRETPEPAPSSQ